MSNLNLKPSARALVVAAIDPDANTAGALTSDWVPMAEFKSVLAIFQAGVLGTSATLDGKLVQATDGSGTGVKDITGKAITQLVKATDDDKQALINCRDDELDVEGGFTHVAMVMTVGTATSDSSAVMLGMDPDSSERADLASVAEIVD